LLAEGKVLKQNVTPRPHSVTQDGTEEEKKGGQGGTSVRTWCLKAGPNASSRQPSRYGWHFATPQPDIGEDVERRALWKLGKMDGMEEDMELTRLIKGWLSRRDTEMAKALILIANNPAPGDDPLAGQRGDDLRALATGEITMRRFRRRARAWPTS
jgi:hypothetical protein